MKVWELIAFLHTQPAGNDVKVSAWSEKREALDVAAVDSVVADIEHGVLLDVAREFKA